MLLNESNLLSKNIREVCLYLTCMVHTCLLPIVHRTNACQKVCLCSCPCVTSLEFLKILNFNGHRGWTFSSNPVSCVWELGLKHVFFNMILHLFFQALNMITHKSCPMLLRLMWLSLILAFNNWHFLPAKALSTQFDFWFYWSTRLLFLISLMSSVVSSHSILFVLWNCKFYQNHVISIFINKNYQAKKILTVIST